MTDRLSSAELETIRAFLASQSSLALATVNANGHPEIAPLFYVSDEALNLYWLSSPTSRHSLNLMAHGWVAAAIYPAVWQWAEIRGLQIEGAASTVTEEEARAEILRLYRRKFDLPVVFEGQIAASTLYVLRPKWMRWLDNGVRFGHKAELEF